MSDEQIFDFENEEMRKSDATAREDAERAEINNY
jgi:hypothetical protein